MMDIIGVLLGWCINILIKKTSGGALENKILSNKELSEELQKPIIRKFEKQIVFEIIMPLLKKFKKGFRFFIGYY